jgi:hypothetical protein
MAKVVAQSQKAQAKHCEPFISQRGSGRLATLIELVIPRSYTRDDTLQVPRLFGFWRYMASEAVVTHAFKKAR